MITVITPTYNRSYTLDILYNSLVNQKNKNFLWFLVDDGSTDDTKSKVNEWINQNKINIIYIYKKNGGKPSAVNLGINKCESNFFIVVDSDDYLVSDAIEILNSESQKLTNEYYGIVAYKLIDGKIICNFPEIEKTKLNEMYWMGFMGDTSLLLRTDYAKRHLYPITNNEKFIPENYQYDRLDKYYVLKVLRKPIISCIYLEDGLTMNKALLVKNNPNSYREFYFNSYKFTRKKIKNYINYCIFVLKTKKTSKKMTFLDNLLFILLMPLTVAVIIKRYIKGVRNKNARKN